MTVAAVNAIAAAAIAAVCGVASIAAVDGQAWPAGGSGSTTTWNPADKTSLAIVLTNGNLTWTDNNASAQAVRSTTGVSAGGVYWEVLAGVTDQGAMGIRIIGDAIGSAVNGGTTCSLRADGTLFASGGATSAGGSAPAGYVAGDVLMFYLDMATGKLWIGKNGVWPGSTNPVTNTGHTFTSIPAGTHHAYNWSDNNSTDCSATLNCGAVSFYYPAVFAALQAIGATAL